MMINKTKWGKWLISIVGFSFICIAQASHDHRYKGLLLTCLLSGFSFCAHAGTTDIQNTREFISSPINSSNVYTLQLNWTYQTAPDTGNQNTALGSISATPLVKGKYIYFNDFSGNITKLNRFTGQLIWKKNYITDLSTPGYTINQSRNTPYIVGNLVIVGSNYYMLDHLCKETGGSPAVLGCHMGDGGIVLALNKDTGNLVWKQKVDSHPSSKISGSISGIGNIVIVPVSNWEEEWARTYPDITQPVIDPKSKYPCCSNRGSTVALEASTGKILWKSYVVIGNDDKKELPSSYRALLTPKGFFGASAYGHNPTIDLKRGQVYIATAQNSTAPKVAEDCEKKRRSTNNVNANIPGLPSGVTCSNLNDKLRNYASSIIALDLYNGKVKWAYHSRHYDAWNHSCAAPDFHGAGIAPSLVFPTPIANTQNCFYNPIGPDNGFGQMPMLLKFVKMPNGSYKDLVVVGNKDGRLFALNPDTGSEVWETDSEPGGVYGGMQFGRASDGKTIYFGTSNTRNINRDRTKPFVTAEKFLKDNGFEALGVRTGTFTKGDGSPIVSYPAPSLAMMPFPGPQIVLGVPEYPSVYPDPDGTGGPPPFLKGPTSGPAQIWTLINPPSDVTPDGITVFTQSGKLRTTSGMVHAVDAATGKILWQRPAYDGIKDTLNGSLVFGTLTVGNGVVFVGYGDGKGTMVALDAKTGVKLFEFHNQIPVDNTMVNAGSIEGGPIVVGRRVYWGVGADLLSTFPDKNFILHNGGNRLYSFILPYTQDDTNDIADMTTNAND